jgi:predicted RecA/RadA family phage recombinase
MKNAYSDGRFVEVTAPYALVSGAGCLVGSLFGIATKDAANGAPAVIDTKGGYTITALTADTGSIGTKVYWDNTNKRITTTSSGNTLVGCLIVAKINTDTTAVVRLNGIV